MRDVRAMTVLSTVLLRSSFPVHSHWAYIKRKSPGVFPLGPYQAEIPRCIPTLDETFGCIYAWG